MVMALAHGAFEGMRAKIQITFLPAVVRQPSDHAACSKAAHQSLTIVAQGNAGKTIADGCTSITRVVLLLDPPG
jgi:hypothetical protein